jgi:hypothetical protein
MYMYRNKNGKSVFTGFIRDGNEADDDLGVVWIGKDERAPRRRIRRDDPASVEFFLSEMKSYDKK